MLTIISIISVVVGVVVCIYLCTRIRKETITLNSLKRENEACRTSLDIYEKSIELKQLEKDKLDKQIYETQVKHNSLSEQLRVLGEQSAQATDSLQKLRDSVKETYDQTSASYLKILEMEYDKKEKEYDDLCTKLKCNYDNLQEQLMLKKEQVEKEISSLKQLRASIVEANRREKSIEDNVAFYCLTFTTEQLSDIKHLNIIKKDLFNPRVLSMLIWKEYYQKPLKTLAANVLNSTEVVCGIYKITNLETKECYVGQSVDVAKRFSDHVKCGLGIDTPSGNKLYASMQEFGIQNFSFELLEQCDREELNQKEKFYISLYQSCENGFNSNKGIN